MNILILSCGTRYKLVEYFKNRDNSFDKVVVTDCSEYAPALYISDKYYIVSRMNKDGYIDEIIDICKKENINVILPLQEDEILLISKNRKRFEDIGILVAISDYSVLSLCKDKYELYNYLNKEGVPVVKTQLLKDILDDNTKIDEVFVKPRYGAGSVGTMKVKTNMFLKALYEESGEELIVQPFIQGKEYGVDVYIDFISSDIKAIFCKEKLRMRAGETEKSKSVKISEIEEMVKKVVGLLQLKGPVDIDIMEYYGNYYVLEINPRFGGGYPHAYECGVNFLKMMAVNAKGQVNTDNVMDYHEGVVALKYSDIVIR